MRRGGGREIEKKGREGKGGEREGQRGEEYLKERRGEGRRGSSVHQLLVWNTQPIGSRTASRECKCPCSCAIHNSL